MKRAFLPVLLVSGALAACGSPGDPTDGGVEAGLDGAPDVAQDGPLDGPADGTTDGPFVDASDDAALDAPIDQDAGDSDLEASDPDATPDASDAALDGPAPDAPFPPQCGDGYRDPSVEECDDGLGTTTKSRACTETCIVTDRIVGDAPDVQERWLASPQAVASGPTGHAIAVVEQFEHPNDLEPVVTVTLFDMAGRRLGTSQVTGVDFDVAPALAALPDGAFALVVSEMGLDGEGLGLGLYRVPATGGTPTFSSIVNESTAYGQHGPAVAWADSELVIAWLDDSPSFDPQGSGRRVCTRRYDATLSAITNEDCFAESDGWPSDLAVASNGSSAAIGWREMHMTTDRIVVEGDGWRWESDALEATSAFEPPALAWLPGGALLVIATEGDGVHRGTVLDVGSPLVSFDALTSPTGLPRYEPALAVTEDGIYVAWSEPEGSILSEVWLQKMVWTGAAIDTSAYAPVPLPRESGHRAGDQHRPVLVSVVDPGQPGPGGAVLACWNDRTSDNYPDQSPHGDAVLELIPTPILRGVAY